MTYPHVLARDSPALGLLIKPQGKKSTFPTEIIKLIRYKLASLSPYGGKLPKNGAQNRKAEMRELLPVI